MKRNTVIYFYRGRILHWKCNVYWKLPSNSLLWIQTLIQGCGTSWRNGTAFLLSWARATAASPVLGTYVLLPFLTLAAAQGHDPEIVMCWEDHPASRCGWAHISKKKTSSYFLLMNIILLEQFPYTYKWVAHSFSVNVFHNRSKIYRLHSNGSQALRNKYPYSQPSYIFFTSVYPE